MTIQVTGKNLDVGEALRSYVQERVVHTVEKFIGREPTGHVRIEINGVYRRKLRSRSDAVAHPRTKKARKRR